MSDVWISCLGDRPSYQTSGSCAADLTSSDLHKMPPGSRAVVGTNLRIAIPRSHVGLICPRSGLAARHGVTVLNAPGVVDSDYRGEIKVVLANLGEEEYVVKPGDRIAQLLLTPRSLGIFVPCETLDETARGDGGFGSTGN